MYKISVLSVTVFLLIHVERLHVGDQILVVDGISLTEVTHADAVAALKKAMNMESVSN